MMEDQIRLAKVETILQDVDLNSDILKQLFHLNKKSNDLPYHNFQHLLTVTIRAFEGGKAHSFDKELLQNIVLASLSHDADYTVGASETVNISAAKKILYQISPAHLFDKSAHYIDATEFPHNEADCIASSVIQDADLMQGFEKDASKFLNGLCIEKNDPNVADPAFPGVQGFNTEWGKTTYLSYFPAKTA